MADITMIVDAAVVVPVNIAPIVDASTGATFQAVAYNAAGMDLRWNFVTTRGAVTCTAVTPTTAGVHDWTDNGDGMCSMEIPASGGTVSNDTEGFGWWTGKVTASLPFRGPVVQFSPTNIVDGTVTGTDKLDVNAAEHGGTVQTGRDIGASVLLSSGTGTGQVNLSSGRVDANLTYVAGAAHNASTAQLGVNVVNAAGTAWNSGGITASTFAGNAITAASIAPAALDADALATDAVNEIVAAIKAMVVEANNSITFGQATSLILSACAGVTSSGGTVLKDPAGVSTRITATIDGSNNRTAMTITPSA
jgi:hypothetical protein